MDLFTEHMIDACTAAEVGFYYEEGGCWGMALALYQTFTICGYEPKIAIATEQVHAMVEVNGRLFDHSGEVFNWVKPIDHVSPERMLLLATTHGWTIDEVMSDFRAAQEVIDLACHLSQSKSADRPDHWMP
jgi:hypothetical protein